MATTPTTKPVPSADANDFASNIEQIDIAVNGATGQKWKNRLTGQEHLNLADAVQNQATLAVNLANDADPAKGVGMVGVAPITSSPSVVETLSGTLRAVLTSVICRIRMLYDSSVVNANWYPTLQDAIDAVSAAGGGTVFIPKGTRTIAGLTAKSNVILQGEGDKTELVTESDISAVSHIAATVDTQLAGFEMRDLYIRNTVTGTKTKYDIHLQNPILCKLIRVHVRSAHPDTAYSDINVGGVYLERVDGSTVPSWINTIKDCFIQNNSIKMKSISDSVLEGGWIWGHTRQFSVHLENCANLRIANVPGIIPSQYKGGIWISGLFTNQLSIINCEFDGNPDLITGEGIVAEGISRAVTVSQNALWNNGRAGMKLVDIVGWTVSGNNFWNCNRDDSGWSDIEIHGATLSPTKNTFTANTHVIDSVRANKGYAVRELNSGVVPTGNTYQSNAIEGNYLNGGILRLGAGPISGNIGLGAEEVNSLGGNQLTIHKTATVASGGVLDVPINITTFLGTPGGFVGQLIVSSVQSNAVTYSRKTVYTAIARGATLSLTSAASQDGASGGVAFTITMPSNGTLRFTDTSGAGVAMYVNILFNGVKTET